jgi:spore photoproduct lyase
LVEELSERDKSDKRKFKEAAYKAWRTIRTERRVRHGMGNRQLVEFVKPAVVTSLVHPETVPQIEPAPPETSFGGGLVSLFHKTPGDIACGPFWELRWAFGCPLDCSYCYLRGTMRGKMKPRFVKFEHIDAALDQAFTKLRAPSIFNSGELSDSLMNPAIMSQIADRFDRQSRHKLSTLSKFGPKNVKFLVEKPRRNVICAWSVNAVEVAKRWERAAAPPEKRIEAARMVQEAGYDVRIRFDPVFPIEDWKSHYQDIIYRLIEQVTPSRIILGTPRGLWKTIKYAGEAGINMNWTDYFKEDSGWGKKLAFDQRFEIYSFFYDKLSAIGFSKSRITMCKETVNMWEKIGLRYTPSTCNCYGRNAFNP